MGTLDERLAAVLALPGGRSASLVRAFLLGLRAGLEDIPADDPGKAQAEALAGAIGELLGARPGDAAPRRTSAVPAGGGHATPRRTEEALRADLLALRENVARNTGEPSIGDPADDLARAWTTVHLSALRLPRAEAETVRREAAELARRAGAKSGQPRAAHTVYGVTKEILVPELQLDGHVEASGLAVSPRGRCDPKLRPRERAEEVTPPLFALTAQVMALIEEDPCLRHCLQVIEFSGLRNMADMTERRVFADHLTRRSLAVAEATPFTGPWLDALVRLHEALCSVVHLPPAPDDSWWGEQRLACNEALAEAAADTPEGSVRFPPARYRSVEGLTRHDIPIELPRRSGQVLACVRAWSRIDGSVNPGRVIYAS